MGLEVLPVRDLLTVTRCLVVVAWSLRTDRHDREERVILSIDSACVSSDGKLCTGSDVVRTSTCAYLYLTWLNDEVSGNSRVAEEAHGYHETDFF
jgi:hypothetical protein